MMLEYVVSQVSVFELSNNKIGRMITLNVSRSQKAY